MTEKKGAGAVAVRTFTETKGGREVRVGIFTDRFYGEQEKFESPADCEQCGRPMPKLATYTGPTCPYIYGGCGNSPEGSRHIFDGFYKPEARKKDAQ